MDILKFITAGNIDDGKSTLIGRLLYDTQNIKTDILHSVSAGDGTDINLAHITDGLRSEREQGITIDVAYKYFTTPNRKYIITDAPGHFQYTRNLVTGASNVDVMIILVDASHGITEQTRRHLLAATFLQIRQVVVAINKMDLINYSEDIFNTIKNDFAAVATKSTIHNITYIPLSALHGENVTTPSEKMSWYKGRALMQYLEQAEPIQPTGNAARFSVQYATLSNGEHLYAGKMLSGTIAVNETVTIYPGKETARIAGIIHGYNQVEKAYAGQNVSLYISGNAARGSLIAHLYAAPCCTNTVDASICWLDSEAPLQLDREYILRINAMETTCTIPGILSKTDIHTFEQLSGGESVAINEFAKVRIQTKEAIVYDAYTDSAENARGIIIDPETNYTCGAFIIS